MIKNPLLPALLAICLGLGGGAAMAAGSAAIEDVDFPFEGPFGSYDRAQLQRGLQVYTEVCAACHGLQYVPFRALEALGYSDEEVRAYAKNYFVADTAEGAEPGAERTAEPTDHFPNGTFAGAPDLSLMAKARAGFSGPTGSGINQFMKGMGGPEYITSLLSHGYADAPECAADADIGGQYNSVFANGGYPEECLDDAGHRTVAGSWINMPAPLVADGVTYADNTSTSVEQQAQDVSAFLMWAAEPKLNSRKQWGMTMVLYLAFLTGLLYFANKKLWAPIKRKG